MKQSVFPINSEDKLASTNLLVADDHFIIREGLSLLIKKLNYPYHVIHAENFRQAIEVLQSYPISLVVLDVSIPGGGDTKMISIIKEVNLFAKILMYSGHDNRELAFSFIKAGANGYLTKTGSLQDLINALQVVEDGGMYISEDLLNNELDQTLKILSAKEMQIAALFANGKGNIEICNELNLKSSTVSTYKTRIFTKLGIESLHELTKIFSY